MWTCFFFSSSFLASVCFLWRTIGQEGEHRRPTAGSMSCQPKKNDTRAERVYSRAVERADVTVGGFLLDVGCDDGWVWDARGVQTVVRGHHVWGEPRGQKTV